MNTERITNAIDTMQVWLDNNFPEIEAERVNGAIYLLLNYESDQIIVAHLKHMITIMRKMPLDDASEREKLMRWLGWMQGALWSRGYFSLDTFREINSSEQVEK